MYLLYITDHEFFSINIWDRYSGRQETNRGNSYGVNRTCKRKANTLNINIKAKCENIGTVNDTCYVGLSLKRGFEHSNSLCLNQPLQQRERLINITPIRLICSIDGS